MSTYLQLESVDGATTLRLDQQETTGSGWQAVRVTGLGMGPVALTTTNEQAGSTVRFVRKAERNVDIQLNLKATSLANRESKEASLYSLLSSGELKLRRVSSASNKYLAKVYYVGGGTYTEGDGETSDTELDLVITLRAHDPDWH